MNIEIPLAIGQTAYGIRNFKGKKTIQKGVVSEMFFTNNMELMICIYFVCRGKYGETIFSTYEDAKKRLEEATK